MLQMVQMVQSTFAVLEDAYASPGSCVDFPVPGCTDHVNRRAVQPIIDGKVGPVEPIIALETAVRCEPDVTFPVFGDIPESGSTKLRKALPSPLFEDRIWLFGTKGLC